MIDGLPSHRSARGRRCANPNLVSRTGRSPLRRRTWRAALTVALLGSAAPAHAQTWDHTLGNAANTSLADVVTAQARSTAWKATGLGAFASGVGPVLGPDGTVYLGNFAGELRAIRPDGSQAWLRKVLRDQHIVTSPVIGADGSIYVVGSKAERSGDHDTYDTTLYRFDAGGGMRWSSNFPTGILADRGAGQAAAAPNIWRSGEAEVIVVPAVQLTYGGYDVQLIAFSATGALLANQTVTSVRYEITGGFECPAWLGCFIGRTPQGDSCERTLPHLPWPPLPATAMFARSGEPVVIVADSYQHIVGYALSAARGFEEVIRKKITNDAIRMSTPAALRDGHSLADGWAEGQAWLLFAGPHPANWTEVVLPEFTRQTPTVTADGRIVTLSQDGLAVIRTFPSVELFQTVAMPFADGSARAAASRNHLFISTCSALLTLDAATFLPVGQFDWQGGGAATPAIGADGRVYALAGGTLFMFAAPPKPCAHCQNGQLPGKNGGVLK